MNTRQIKFPILQEISFSLKFVELYDLATAPIVLSHLTTESPIILFEFLLISLAHILVL